MNIGDLFFGLKADDARLQADVKKSGDKAGKALAEHTSQAFSESIKRGFGFGVGIGLFNALQDAVGGVASGIEGLIATSLSKAGEIERFQVQFETLLGSEEAAEARLKELVEFAATTPFQLPEVISASRTLQVFTQGVLATGDGLRMVGDIAAGTGQPFQDVAMWIGRLYDAMQSGRPFGEATMRLQEMGALSGENRALIERLAASVKAGNMTMTDAWTTTGGVFSQFAGLMDKQSGTLEGQLSNLADAIDQSFAAVGDALDPIAKAVIPEVIALVKGLGESISAFIRDHALELKQVILDITNALFGFVSGLFGIEKAITGTTSSVAAVAQVGLKAGMGFKEWRQATGNMPSALDKTTASTKAATTAVDRQIKTTDKAIAAEKRRADGLLDAIDAQEKQLDLAEEQISIDERRRDLNDQLNEAQLSLTEAQGGGDAQGVSDAMAKIADIQEEQAKNEHDLGVDAQRDKLQLQRDEIEAKSQAKQDELQGLKDQLQEQRAAISAAGSGQVSDNAKKLGDLKAQYQKYLDGELTATTDMSTAARAALLGDPAAGTGIGGAITKAFTDGKAAGEAFRKFITDDLIPAFKGVLDVVGEILGVLTKIANYSDTLAQLLRLTVGIAPVMRPEELPKAQAAAKTFTDTYRNEHEGRSPTEDEIRKFLTDQGFLGVRADGGPVRPGMPYVVGERRPELFVPDQRGSIMPSLDAMSGWQVTRPIEITVVSVLDGREVARSTGRVFADELRH